MKNFQALEKRRMKHICVIILVICLAFVFAACNPEGTDQVSYIGPKIEDIRQMYVVEGDGTGKTQLFPAVRGLGSTLIWHPSGERAIVFTEEEGDYYMAEVGKGRIGECLTCDFEEFGGPAFSPDGEAIA
jgi:hypothetical protein